jgi:hypothetical protein
MFQKTSLNIAKESISKYRISRILKQSIQKQDEPIVGVKGKKLSKKGKSKPVVNYPSESKTRETNKLRLNSKAIFHPAIKK